MLSDVCRNTKTQEQLYGSMDLYVKQSNKIYDFEGTQKPNHLVCKGTFT